MGLLFGNCASIFNWVNLWVESYSKFVVNLFKHKSQNVPWNLWNKWINALLLADQLNIRIARIYREWNCVADKLTSTLTPLSVNNWRFSGLIYRDMIPFIFLRFRNSSSFLDYSLLFLLKLILSARGFNEVSEHFG